MHRPDSSTAPSGAPFPDNVIRLDPRESVRTTRTGGHINKLIWLLLVDRANGKGACWPSVATLARDAECCRRSVQKALAALEQRGLIAREKRHGPAGRLSTRYVVHYPEPVSAAKSPANAPRAATPAHLVHAKMESKEVVQKIVDHRANAHPPDGEEQQGGTCSSQPTPADLDTPDIAQVAYRAYQTAASAHRLAEPPPLTGDLRKKLRTAVTALDGGAGEWKRLLHSEIPLSAYLCGKTPARPRPVELQWLVRPGNSQKVASGHYRNRSRPAPTSPADLSDADRKARYRARRERERAEERWRHLNRLRVNLFRWLDDTDASFAVGRKVPAEQMAGVPVAEMQRRMETETKIGQAAIDQALQNAADPEAAISVQWRWTPEMAAFEFNIPEAEMADRMAAEAARYPAVVAPRNFEAEKRENEAAKAELFSWASANATPASAP